jgi:NADPH:quinone reductase-like Zn-dependent oxidoreductase
MNTMLAAVVEALGDAPRPLARPVPEPQHGQALIQVTAAAVNPIDLLISAGHHPAGAPDVPHVPGIEGVGRVVRGSGLAPGARVRFIVQGGFVSGGLAQYTVADERQCLPVPDGIDDVTAAAAGTVGVGALVSLRDRAALRPGEHVLVLAGTGAFGQMFIQLAKLIGAGRVVAAGRRKDRLDVMRELGADGVFALPEPVAGNLAWLAQAAGERFDVIADPLWGPYAAGALACLNPGGRLLNVGQLAAAYADINGGLIRHNAATIVGFSGASLTPEATATAYREIAGYLADKRIVVSTISYPLDDIAAAWQAQLASPGTKIVITPPAPTPQPGMS